MFFAIFITCQLFPTGKFWQLLQKFKSQPYNCCESSKVGLAVVKDQVSALWLSQCVNTFISKYNFYCLQNGNLPIFIPRKVLNLPTFSIMLSLLQFCMRVKIKPTNCFNMELTCCEIFLLRISGLTIITIVLCFMRKQAPCLKNIEISAMLIACKVLNLPTF